MVKKQLIISFLGRKMFLSVSSKKDQIHTFQEAVFFVNNTLKAIGLLNIPCATEAFEHIFLRF